MPEPVTPDSYCIPTGPSTGEFRDRGSKFVAHLASVRTEAEALAVVDEQRGLHHKCNHHCYAYRLGPGDDRWRANDDGEPSGTAGKPILGQLDKAGVSDAVIVVSRYYGGTKLGTSGLINAYREAARLALDTGTTGLRYLTTRVQLDFGYALMGPVMSALDQLGLAMTDQDFSERARVMLELPCSTAGQTLRELKAAVAGVYVDEVDADFVVEGLGIVAFG